MFWKEISLFPSASTLGVLVCECANVALEGELAGAKGICSFPTTMRGGELRGWFAWDDMACDSVEGN